ncbi:MAG: hypothetical protein HHAS10_11790 [Candidatus Altimarinota bacterium]
MPNELLFAIISTFIYLSGSIFYWRDTIRGRTIPHPFVNFIGLILVGFNFFVLYTNQQYYSLIPLVFLLFSQSIFGIGYGIRGFHKIHINWFDYLSLGLSIILIIYWYISQNILYTVIFSCIIDITIMLPIFKKSWISPWTETSIAWFTGILNIGFMYLAQSGANVETSLYWVVYITLNGIVVGILISRRYYLKGWKGIFQ